MQKSGQFETVKLNRTIFRAYDIRGKYPTEINEEAVGEIAQELFRFFGKNSKIIIGHDARLSSPSLYQAIQKASEAGLNLKLIPVGLITTPMLYFLVNFHKADGGIMVTASHNPKEYNGLKVVGKNTMPISGTKILEIMQK